MPKPQSELPNNKVTAHPDLEKRSRHRFTTEYMLRILAEADQCQHGEIVALLRREKLYSRQLTTWRRELESDGVEKLGKSTPGTKAAKTSEQKRIEQLEKELARTRRKLEITEYCVDLQKKALSMLDRRDTDKVSCRPSGEQQ